VRCRRASPASSGAAAAARGDRRDGYAGRLRSGRGDVGAARDERERDEERADGGRGRSYAPGGAPGGVSGCAAGWRGVGRPYREGERMRTPSLALHNGELLRDLASRRSKSAGMSPLARGTPARLSNSLYRSGCERSLARSMASSALGMTVGSGGRPHAEAPRAGDPPGLGLEQLTLRGHGGDSGYRPCGPGGIGRLSLQPAHDVHPSRGERVGCIQPSKGSLT
jgi:hypothetical protein